MATAETSLTSAGLISAANEALLKAQKDINVLRLFSTDYSNEFGGINQTIMVPVIDAGTSTSITLGDADPDYEALTGNISYVDLKMDKFAKNTFKFNGEDVLDTPNAPYWNKCAEAGAQAISTALSKAFGGLFKVATEEETTGMVEVTLGSVTKANLAALREKCAGRIADTVLALAPAQYAEMLALFDSNVYGGTEAIRNGKVEGLYGFKAVVELRDAGTGVKGALVPASAIAVASRPVSVADKAIYSEFGTVSDENNFTISVFRHGSAQHGFGYINIAAVYGMKVIKPEEVVILK